MPDPDFTITIDFNPTGNPKITLDQPSLDIPFGTFTVQWVLAANVPAPTSIFALVDWHPENPFEDSPSATNSFTGTDENANDTEEDQIFTYDVVLLHDGIQVRDPEIVNQTGGGPGAFQLHYKSR